MEFKCFFLIVRRCLLDTNSIRGREDCKESPNWVQNTYGVTSPPLYSNILGSIFYTSKYSYEFFI